MTLKWMVVRHLSVCHHIYRARYVWYFEIIIKKYMNVNKHQSAKQAFPWQKYLWKMRMILHLQPWHYFPTESSYKTALKFTKITSNDETSPLPLRSSLLARIHCSCPWWWLYLQKGDSSVHAAVSLENICFCFFLFRLIQRREETGHAK